MYEIYLREFMESVHTDEEDGEYSIGGNLSSEDELDPTYEPRVISPEHEREISQCLRDLETTDIFVAQAVGLSELDIPSNSEDEGTKGMGSMPSTSTPPISKETRKKRARSPLPSIETTGPTCLPSTGGFNGTIKNKIN